MSKFTKFVFSLCASALIVWLFTLGIPSSLLANTEATTWFVNTSTGNDNNTCVTTNTACKTIGRALSKADNGDTIQVAAGVYLENDLQIDKVLSLVGAGRDSTILDGAQASRVLFVGSDAIIADLSIRNGRIITAEGDLFDQGGGAMLVSSAATLILRNTRLISNSAVGVGGAILNLGNLHIEGSEIISNNSESNGGGIYNYVFGSLTISETLIAGNRAAQDGGAIDANRPITLTDVTVRDNLAGTFAGGLLLSNLSYLNRVTLHGNRATAAAAIFSQQGTHTLLNVTVSENVASNNQPGIYLAGSVSMTVQNSTIANNRRTNSAGAGLNGLVTGDLPVRIINTIIANNGTGNRERNCGGVEANFLSLGNNLASDFSCAFKATGDIEGVDPLLSPLANYGGSTPTHALLPGSAALDAGSDANCPAVDQRKINRPIDGDSNGVATCDIGAFEVRSQLLIADTQVLEGSGILNSAYFTVTLAPTSTQSVTVDFATKAGSAALGSDYSSASGTLTFAPGEASKVIAVTILGDPDDEPDESFSLQLFNAINADLVDASAIGTIIDDDSLPALTIADTTLLEGNTGSQAMQFVVTLSPASAQAVTVNYNAVNGSAQSDSDFQSSNGTLTFAAGQTSQTISVQVTGDGVDEGEVETFTIMLSGVLNANLGDDSAVGTITDDDATSMSLGFASEVNEEDLGFTPALFTVTLSTPAAFTITVDYTASSGPVGDEGAKSNEDFSLSNGTLIFAPGVTVRTFVVQVIGDLAVEKDERFQVQISNATVPIQANVSLGVILNDDVEGKLPPSVYLPLVVR